LSATGIPGHTGEDNHPRFCQSLNFLVSPCVSSEPGSHGTTADKQGRSAGENALGGDREIAGSLGTQVVKYVFDQAAARTGLRDHEAALLLNSFEELAAIATVRNWLVLDAKRFDARARYL